MRIGAEIKDTNTAFMMGATVLTRRVLEGRVAEMLGFVLPKGPQEGANAGEPQPPLGSSPSSSSSILPKLSSLQLPLVSRSAR